MDVFEKLKRSNEVYLAGQGYSGDVTEKRRMETSSGQHPYLAVLTCADSRVIPEIIFQAGIGDIFTVRVAGNVVFDSQLASIEYAVSHLHLSSVLVLGHTGCGAVGAALADEHHGKTAYITKRIRETIGNEQDPLCACKLNVEESVRILRQHFSSFPVTIQGAIYDITSGKVSFLD